ncbi:RelA/SpoT family protein [Canibacter oris]|uniref:GTP pyrophosphokinase n=1 Tax=Canibacter oris TaxID=1365628 RepID=A0A840DG16_9MICO|nr:bifunctional (p)ppGpp synthetase/guanosine-3',5'-bis(diphosphate) 3'-pyrophosphohydrolase [Canibacter oris]MBB4071660.1 GTP pyrophosphokinase [Canibacter oris]
MASNGAPSSIRRFVPRVFGRGQNPEGIEQLIRTVKANHPRSDLDLIRRAYAVAAEYHRTQVRKSGEPYITHPVAVAQILADLGVTATVVAGALLHDTVEDTDYTVEQLTADFGAEIALLVDGVTKLDKLQYGEAAQAETVRKMIVAMTKDIRVLVIKLADRLHNARTWGFMPAEKARSKAKETLEIYAPLAHRLGIQSIKTELEDLSFAVLKPKLYSEIENLVAQRNPQREELVQKVTDALESDLRTHKLRGTVTGRPKELYSIYQKMVVRGKDFDEIYDLVGIRVLVESIRDCYAVLGAVHARWIPIPGRFKDYIASPKFNLYQSLHTSVIGPDGRAVEIQVRTYEMHQRAEYGVAAHWKYKQNQRDGGGDKNIHATEMAWLSHINDWQAETADPGEFLEALRFEIGAKEVYVFTPQGKAIGLPAGATPVDFAFAVHTTVGYKTMGARVNSRLVGLETVLKTGDVVEVLTSNDPNAGPSKDWLNFVKSKRAQNKIRQWFTKERRADAAESGKEQLFKELRKQNLPLQRLMQADAIKQVALELHYADIDSLYIAIGEGRISAQKTVERLQQTLAGDDNSEAESVDHSLPAAKRLYTKQTNDCGVVVRGEADLLVKLAKCCTPVPGDDIGGFVTRGQGVSVHRTECLNYIALQDQAERLIEVTWAENQHNAFLVNIQVEALDRSRLLSDVTRVLAEHHVNILSASVQTSSSRVATSRFTFEMANATHLERVLNAVRRIDGVYDVYRVNTV